MESQKATRNAEKGIKIMEMNRDAWFEDQIVKDLHHLMSVVAEDKQFWIDLGYTGDGFTAEKMIGIMLKSFAERGSKIAQTGKLEDMAGLNDYSNSLSRKEEISIQPGDVVAVRGDKIEDSVAFMVPKGPSAISIPIPAGPITLEVYREQVKDGD